MVAIYSTFLQRGYDQLIHDVALQNLPVVFALDRAGLVGGDGATHQGSFDLSFLRCIPNMVVMAPADENECRQMLYTATTLRRPGGGALSARHRARRAAIERGDDRAAGRPRRRSAARAARAWRCSPSARCSPAALAVGRAPRRHGGQHALRQAAGRATLVLRLIARSIAALVTVEENVVAGGAGSAWPNCWPPPGCRLPQLHIGIPDRFIEHGSRDDCLAAAGLDPAGLQRTIERWWTPTIRPREARRRVSCPSGPVRRASRQHCTILYRL